MTTVTNAQIIAALRKNGGIQAHAAAELGIDRSTLHGRIKKSPQLQETMRTIEETVLDAAEGNVIKSIVTDKDGAMSRWYLERKGKSRGYSLQEIHITIDARSITQIVNGFAGLDLDALRRLRDEVAALPTEEPKRIS